MSTTPEQKALGERFMREVKKAKCSVKELRKIADEAERIGYKSLADYAASLADVLDDGGEPS